MARRGTRSGRGGAAVDRRDADSSRGLSTQDRGRRVSHRRSRPYPTFGQVVWLHVEAKGIAAHPVVGRLWSTYRVPRYGILFPLPLSPCRQPAAWAR